MYHDQALIPIKTIAFDDGRQRHAGAALHPHLAGPRHRLRHRREGLARPDSLAARRTPPASLPLVPAAPRHDGGRPAAAAGGRADPRLAPNGRSARISSLIST
jgi:hypothetical protein